MNKARSSKTDNYSSIVHDLAPYMGLSWQMIIIIGVFVLLGWWLDTKFDTKPILLIIGSCVGIAAALYSFIRTVTSLDKKNKLTQNLNNNLKSDEKEEDNRGKL